MDKIYIYIVAQNTLKVAMSFLKSNWIYLAWFLFYAILFTFITRGLALVFYMISVPIALSPIAEKVWRSVSGVRPLRLRVEKERLLPLFKEVYEGAVKSNPNLFKGIKLYIKEDMTINAFAFGKSTLVLTRGSIMLLSDECLKGLIAHEFGHFSHRHTEAILIAMIGNLPLMFIIRKLTDVKNHFNNSENKGTLITGIFALFFDLIYYLFKGLEVIGDLVLTFCSREHEYVADEFAFKSGFGQELTDALSEIYNVSISKPQSVREQLRSTHPHITLRIEELEAVIY